MRAKKLFKTKIKSLSSFSNKTDVWWICWSCWNFQLNQKCLLFQCEYSNPGKKWHVVNPRSKDHTFSLTKQSSFILVFFSISFLKQELFSHVLTLLKTPDSKIYVLSLHHSPPQHPNPHLFLSPNLFIDLRFCHFQFTLQK